MFTRNHYSTNKPMRTIWSRLFGWSRCYFHLRMLYDVYYYMSKRRKTGTKNYLEAVYRGCWNLIEAIEAVGGKVEFSGFENFRNVDGPVVFVGNHMSTLETTIIPALVMPNKNVTFIVKEELMKTPVFRDSIIMLDSIAVTRKDPKADFKTMMSKGLAHIENGTSIVVFPQTTRTVDFEPEKFGSIGIKLAKKAGVKVIPVAVKTDFLKNGKLIKDIGPIDTKKTVHIAFGEALEIEGAGKEQHQSVIKFIQEKLTEWKES